MKSCWKGALLSGLVFPGLGQLWLRHYTRGIALVIVTTASLAIIVIKAVQQALTLLNRIEAEGGTTDLVAILHYASRVTTASGASLPTPATLVLIGCWTIGVVDAFILGKREDRAVGKGAKGNAAKPDTRGD
jgi:hypothetical protein